MLTLHHATASVASAKVRLVLSEKALPWEGQILDLQRGDQHRPEYRVIHPHSVVPALVHDERVVIESTVIIQYLEEGFPTSVALLAADPHERAITRLWMKKVDERLHPACVSLTFALAFRRALAQKTAEELEARFRLVRDPDLRERQRLAVTKGLDAPHARAAATSYDTVVAEMEEALGRSTFLAGDAYSLADAAITPYVLRAQMLGMDGLWNDQRPNVARWFERVRARPSFDDALARVMTDADRQRLTVPRHETWPRVREILDRAV